MERKLETIYAGVDNAGASVAPTGVGPLCEYITADGADKAQMSDTFEVDTIICYTCI